MADHNQTGDSSIELQIVEDHDHTTPMIQPTTTTNTTGTNNANNGTAPRGSVDIANRPAATPRGSVDIAGRPSVEKTKISMDIPRYFEEARQSIDIVQSAERELKDPNILKGKSKKEKKFLEKAKKKAIDIAEHEMTVGKVCEMYGTQFDTEKPEKSFVSITQSISLSNHVPIITHFTIIIGS